MASASGVAAVQGSAGAKASAELPAHRLHTSGLRLLKAAKGTHTKLLVALGKQCLQGSKEGTPMPTCACSCAMSSALDHSAAIALQIAGGSGK